MVTSIAPSNQSISPLVENVDICKDFDFKHPKIDIIIKNIWAYVINYSADVNYNVIYNREMIFWMLKEVRKLLAKEPSVLEVKSPVTVIGPLNGHADALVVLMSLCGSPASKQYLFLGNYTGMGFASLETLFLLFGLKIKYPDKIHLLKGYHEDPEVLLQMDVIPIMQKRSLIPTTIHTPDHMLPWTELSETLSKVPLAALINGDILCLQGGPGHELRREGVARLKKVQRPPASDVDSNITVEVMWAILSTRARKRKETSKWEMPRFTEAEASDFCHKNKIALIVRGRQLVDEGVLNLPKEIVTISSATAYLDNFRNYGAAINFDKDFSKISVARYKILDAEPLSLDDNKPTNGRNAITVLN